MLFRKTFMKLDKLFSPGLNAANLNYHLRAQNLLKEILISRRPVKPLLSFVKIGVMIGLGWLLTPVCVVLRLLKFRFVDIDLSQIGSIMFLDLFLRENLLTLKSPRRRIFVLGSYFYDGNRYILDLYNGHVTFIRNPFLKLLLSPFFVSSIFADDSSRRYETVFSEVAVAHGVWNEYLNIHGEPLIRMPAVDIKKAEESLGDYVDLSRPFVTLHVRETGFYNIVSQNTRNAKIETYKSAIEYLIAKGFVVIRIGDASMEKICDLQRDVGPNLFDYANSNLKSELMDCYLLSQCSFMIGCASGPNCIPPLFHRNCVNVNWYLAINAANFMEGDITTLKRLHYCDNEKLVPFEKLLDTPFRWSPARHFLESRGIKLVDNSEEEILETVVEYLSTPKTTELQIKAKNLLPLDAYSSGARGNFSMVTLKQYFPKEG